MRAELRTVENHTQALQLHQATPYTCLRRSQNFYGNFFVPSISPFLNRSNRSCYPLPAPPCVRWVCWWPDNLPHTLRWTGWNELHPGRLIHFESDLNKVPDLEKLLNVIIKLGGNWRWGELDVVCDKDSSSLMADKLYVEPNDSCLLTCTSCAMHTFLYDVHIFPLDWALGLWLSSNQ